MNLLCFPFFLIHHHPFFFSSVSNHCHRSHFHHKFPKQTLKCSHPLLAAFLQILHVSQVSPSSPLENARSYPGFSTMRIMLPALLTQFPINVQHCPSIFSFVSTFPACFQLVFLHFPSSPQVPQKKRRHRAAA